jgi:hypothetical protein
MYTYKDEFEVGKSTNFFSLHKNEENLLHECTHAYVTFTKIILGTNVKKKWNQCERKNLRWFIFTYE